MNEHIWYGTFFDHTRCSATTKSGEQCRMTPVWKLRETGEVFCDQHAKPVFERLKAAKEASA